MSDAPGVKTRRLAESGESHRSIESDWALSNRFTISRRGDVPSSDEGCRWPRRSCLCTPVLRDRSAWPVLSGLSWRHKTGWTGRGILRGTRRPRPIRLRRASRRRLRLLPGQTVLRSSSSASSSGWRSYSSSETDGGWAAVAAAARPAWRAAAGVFEGGDRDRIAAVDGCGLIGVAAALGPINHESMSSPETSSGDAGLAGAAAPPWRAAAARRPGSRRRMSRATCTRSRSLSRHASAVKALPLTSVPLRLPRSRTKTVSPLMVNSACSRLTCSLFGRR